MKKESFLGILFVGIILLLTGGEAGTQEREDIPTYVPGEILVKWKDWVDEPSIELMHSRREATVVSTFYATHKKERVIQHVRIREGQTVEEALLEYRRDPLVEHAQPNYLFYLQTIPNDPRFGELWGLHNTGQTGGTVDADIDAPEAWGITTGSPGIIIAVIDTGVNYNHPELSGNMWVNRGWDFFDNDNDPMDFHGHGTHVAGTIAAAGNNAAGITGVMWNAQIMALKVTGVEAFGIPLSVVTSAINYAAANGARIINASWNRRGAVGEMENLASLLRGAIEDAGTRGVLFVAAAGNDADNNDMRLSFPASYTLPNIISVAATNRNDALAGFSNFGATSVDVAAPGVSILSTIPTFSYGTPVFLYSTGFDTDAVGAPPSGWVNRGPNNTWAVTEINSVSPPSTPPPISRNFADNPGLNYINNLISTDTLISTATLTYLNTPIAYTKDSRYRFTFGIRYDLETNFDFLDAVGSSDRANWRRGPKRLTGSSAGDFVSRDLVVTELVERFRGAYLGFAIDSDANVTREGVYIDNIRFTREPISIAAHYYAFDNGTSMAAPHVAGLAGLILSVNPTLNYQRVKDIILGNVDIPPSPLQVLTRGRINAHRALLATPLPGPAPAPDPGFCTIATAAFGTPMAEEVVVFSRFRDQYLLTNELGRRFVSLYYRHSPAIAEYISDREWAKRLVRGALLPVVRIVEFIVGEEGKK